VGGLITQNSELRTPNSSHAEDVIVVSSGRRDLKKQG